MIRHLLLTARYLLLALAFGVMSAPIVQAQDLGAIKQSMDKRLPSVDALKASGALGENNKGFLDVRAATGDAAAVSAAENADRRVVYAALAKNAGSSAEAVGQARARQIAAASKAGVWLQSPKGDWYRK